MKKLLIATDSFLPRWDGIARFLSEIIPRLSKKYKIKVVAPDFKGRRVRLKGVEIVRIPLLYRVKVGDYTPSILDVKRIKSLVKEADIVFAQTTGPIGAPAIYYSKKIGKRVVLFVHLIEWELVPKSVKKHEKKIEFVVKKVAKYLYAKCDAIIIPSGDIKSPLRKIGIKAKEIVINVGTDTRLFQPKSKASARKSLGIKDDKIVIGFAGRIGREKNLGTLAKAFSILKKKHSNLLLLIVGSGVKEEIKKLRQKGAKIVGSVDNVERYLQAMDIYVLPSLTETSSLSTMEAMASELPVVVTKVGFLKSYIKDGVNGLFFQKENANMLAEKLEILINNKEMREMLGKEARKTIKEKFKWHDTVRKIERVLS